jgi:hypothetical protein
MIDLWIIFFDTSTSIWLYPYGWLTSTCHSSSHSIPRCWTLRNQFRQRNQFHLIPRIPSWWILIDSQEFLSIPEFDSIAATSTDSGSNEFPKFLNSVQTELDGIERNWNWFLELSQSGIRRDRTEFRELVELVWTDSGNWWELIPGAEPVPQCSTLQNRMYSRNNHVKFQTQLTVKTERKREREIQLFFFVFV